MNIAAFENLITINKNKKMEKGYKHIPVLSREKAINLFTRNNIHFSYGMMTNINKRIEKDI